MPTNSFDEYPMSWRPSLDRKSTPIYLSIAQALEIDIKKGVLKPNDKLPPQRELADYLDVNLSTITRAFKLCESKGLIIGNVGRGTYVSSDIEANLPMLSEIEDSEIINLGASHPLSEGNKSVTQILKKLPSKINIENLLQYQNISGTYDQKESARIWLNQLNLKTSVENILITSGLQNSLAIILTSLFSYGDKVATNAMVYPGFKNIANMLGIRLVPIPFKKNKLDLAYFEQVCKLEKVKGLYIMPDMQNPTTLTMSGEEREYLGDLIKKFSLIAIEDGTYNFLIKDHHDPLYHYAPEHVIHVCTVSNSLSAGLRISFLVTPIGFRENLLTGIRNINVMSSPLESEIVSQLIQTKLANKIVEEKIQEIEKRNRLSDEILGNYKLFGNERSQFRWLLLPVKLKSHQLESSLYKKKVEVFCSDRFLVGNSKCKESIRIAISSPDSLKKLYDGLIIIRDEISHVK